jgi:multidrug transporter EmrE-like cation transporter
VWVLYLTIAATIILGVSVSFTKLDITISNFLILLPFMIVSNLFYWLTYKNGPPLFIVWMIATGLTSILALGISIYIYKQTVDWKIITGSILILLGSLMLNIK